MSNLIDQSINQSTTSALFQRQHRQFGQVLPRRCSSFEAAQLTPCSQRRPPSRSHLQGQCIGLRCPRASTRDRLGFPSGTVWSTRFPFCTTNKLVHQLMCRAPVRAPARTIELDLCSADQSINQSVVESPQDTAIKHTQAGTFVAPHL